MRDHAPTSLLHAYRLHRGQCRTVHARTSAYPDGQLRMTPADLSRLRNSTGPDLTPVTALFSTGSSHIPIALQAYETIWVKTSKAKRVQPNETQKTDQDGQAGQPGQPDHAEWQPLTVTASHAYVRGMRVSGIIHRAVVRLVRYE